MGEHMKMSLKGIHLTMPMDWIENAMTMTVTDIFNEFVVLIVVFVAHIIVLCTDNHQIITQRLPEYTQKSKLYNVRHWKLQPIADNEANRFTGYSVFWKRIGYGYRSIFFIRETAIRDAEETFFALKTSSHSWWQLGKNVAQKYIEKSTETVGKHLIE